MENRAGMLENRGCLTCHSLEKGRPYLKSYEQGNPQSFASNFGAVKKDLCQTCHTSSMARQDCLLCHKYHVNGAITPIMNTRTPSSVTDGRRTIQAHSDGARARAADVRFGPTVDVASFIDM